MTRAEQQDQEIQVQLELCRAAWQAHPEAVFGWNIHHEVELERLEEPIENRIGYILSDKPYDEQAIRFLNMRPLVSPLPPELAKASSELDKASSEWDKARSELAKASSELDKASSEWDKARSELAKASSEWDKASSEWAKARSEWAKARSEWAKARSEWDKAHSEWAKADKAAAHLADVPNHTWDGRSIF